MLSLRSVSKPRMARKLLQLLGWPKTRWLNDNFVFLFSNNMNFTYFDLSKWKLHLSSLWNLNINFCHRWRSRAWLLWAHCLRWGPVFNWLVSKHANSVVVIIDCQSVNVLVSRLPNCEHTAGRQHHLCSPHGHITTFQHRLQKSTFNSLNKVHESYHRVRRRISSWKTLLKTWRTGGTRTR